jgi:hypothetical protein
MEIEFKPFLPSAGVKEFTIGTLLLAGFVYLLQSLLFQTDNLKHIPRLVDDLPKKQKLQQWLRNSKELHRQAHKKVRRSSSFVTVKC